MNLEIELSPSQAVIRTDGYVNRPGGERIARIAVELANRGVGALRVDLSGSPVVNAGALERLVDAKYRLDLVGVPLWLTGLTPTLTKILRLMGLDPSN